MKLSFHHGSGADLQEAIADKIEELSHVESSKQVTAAEVEASISTGSGLELEDAIRNKITELDTSVQSAAEVTASAEPEMCPNCGAVSYYDGVCTTCGFVVDDTDPFDGGLQEDDESVVVASADEIHIWDRIADNVVSELMDQGYWPTYDILSDGIVIHVYEDPGKRVELTTYTHAFGEIDFNDPLNSEDFIQDKVLEAIELQLSEEVTSSTEVKASKDDDPTYRDRYLHSLIGDLMDVLNTNGIQGTLFDNDDENLYITISTPENPATEYQVPFTDLKMDFEKMDEDIDYILDGVLPKGEEDIKSAVEAVAATYRDSNLDPLYHGYLNRAENHIAELSKRYSKGHESPDEILKSLGYVEVDNNLYENEDAPYSIFIDFNQDNDFGADELWVMYYVTKNGHIPRGYCPTKVDIYDAQHDPDVTDDAIPEYTMVATKSVPDADGFMTDYTWYKDSDGLNVFILGDNELYTPENTGFDNIEHSDEAAQEWWENYNGYEDDDDIVTYDADDIYSSEEAECAIYAGYAVVPAGNFFQHGMMYDVTDELPNKPAEGIKVFVWRGPGKQKDYYIQINENRVDHAFNSLTTVMRYLVKNKFAEAVVEAAWERGWYFGKEQADEFGDLIADKLGGRTVSKRIDTAKEPGGLEYEADQLGIDMWDLLGALEGMCYQNRAREIDDSTYEIL